MDRPGAFLTIVGIASLAVGGVGIGAAIRGYMTRKVPVIGRALTDLAMCFKELQKWVQDWKKLISDAEVGVTSGE